MRILFLLFAVCAATTSFSQKKTFIKPSAGLLIFQDGGDTGGEFNLEYGLKFGRWFSTGVSAGVLMLNSIDATLIPVGLNFAFTNNKTDKISPYINFAGFYPIYDRSSTYRFSSGGSTYTGESSLRGSFYGKAGGGVSLPIKKVKLLITANYNYLLLDSKETAVIGSRVTGVRESIGINLYSLNVGFIF